ncbi:MAG: DUF2461 domain-containing protein [Micromonosporaceae bacterium]
MSTLGVVMAFTGWPAEALEFYEGLAADNSRTYWLAHRDVYERDVRAPMEELLAELEPEFGPWKIYRPYRDVRFSADKSPYKDHIGATFERGGYVQLSAHGLAAGNGMWQMDSGQLDRYRRAVADDVAGARLQALVADIRAQGIEVGGHSVLRTAPRGYPRDHPRIELLRYRGLVAWRQWPVEPWLGTPAARDRVVEFLRASAPLRDWLDEHVGPATA